MTGTRYIRRLNQGETSPSDQMDDDELTGWHWAGILQLLTETGGRVRPQLTCLPQTRLVSGSVSSASGSCFHDPCSFLSTA